MSDLKISPVPITLIDHFWPKVKTDLQRVVDRAPDELSLDSIYEHIVNDKIMLVVISDGDEVVACTTFETITFPTGFKVLYVPVIGGNRMDEWKEEFLEFCHVVAKNLKCKEIRGLAARKGWLRKLELDGWEALYLTIKCDVKN